MQATTTKLWERALLLQSKLADDGVLVSYLEARDLLIADFLSRPLN